MWYLSSSILFLFLCNCVHLQKILTASNLNRTLYLSELNISDVDFVCCDCRFSRELFTEKSDANNAETCLELNHNQSFKANQTAIYSENNIQNLELLDVLSQIGSFTNLGNLERRIQSICCNVTESGPNSMISRKNDTSCTFNIRQNSDTHQSWSFCGSTAATTFEPNVDHVLVYLSIASIILLGLTILTYLCLPSLLNIHGKTIVCHLICLMFSYILQTIQYFVQHEVDQKTEERSFYCFVLGIGFYLTSMGALFWLCIVNIDIWHTFTQKCAEDSRDARKRFRKYCIAGFGGPIILTLLVTILEFTLAEDNICKPGIGINTNRCFFSTTHGYSIVMYYYGVTAVMITANLVIFAKTNIALCRIQSAVASARKASTTAASNSFGRLFLFFKLFCVMGTSWIINIVLWSIQHDTFSTDEKSWSARFFECFNVMHGFCYFIIFVCKPSIFRMLRDKVHSISSSGDSTGSTSVTRGFVSNRK